MKFYYWNDRIWINKPKRLSVYQPQCQSWAQPELLFFGFLFFSIEAAFHPHCLTSVGSDRSPEIIYKLQKNKKNRWIKLQKLWALLTLGERRQWDEKWQFWNIKVAMHWKHCHHVCVCICVCICVHMYVYTYIRVWAALELMQYSHCTSMRRNLIEVGVQFCKMFDVPDWLLLKVQASSTVPQAIMFSNKKVFCISNKWPKLWKSVDMLVSFVFTL